MSTLDLVVYRGVDISVHLSPTLDRASAACTNRRPSAPTGVLFMRCSFLNGFR